MARNTPVEVDQPDEGRPVIFAGQPVKMTGRYSGIRFPAAVAR